MGLQECMLWHPVCSADTSRYQKSVGCQHDDIKVLKGTRDSLGPDPFRKRLGKNGGSGLMLRGKRKRAIPLSQKFSRNVILTYLPRNTGAMVYWGHDTMGLWAILVHPGQRLCWSLTVLFMFGQTRNNGHLATMSLYRQLVPTMSTGPWKNCWVQEGRKINSLSHAPAPFHSKSASYRLGSLGILHSQVTGLGHYKTHEMMAVYRRGQGVFSAAWCVRWWLSWETPKNAQTVDSWDLWSLTSQWMFVAAVIPSEWKRESIT